MLDCSPDLYIGVIFAIFNLSGNIPVDNDKLNMYFRGWDMFGNIRFITSKLR